ncbi:MAG: hypothetical protein RLZZ605_630 [Bacteroidota bacterium]|jgi:quinol monooxygenase YgiN
MIIRIVKMHFKPEHIGAFHQLFEERKEQIASFEGCQSVDMLQDIKDPCIHFTYSHWISEEALANYRASAFFEDTWAKTKALFEHKAEAWSTTLK